MITCSERGDDRAAVEPGQILITGALGRMIPGKPGTYTADFGKLGEIAFSAQ